MLAEGTGTDRRGSGARPGGPTAETGDRRYSSRAMAILAFPERRSTPFAAVALASVVALGACTSGASTGSPGTKTGATSNAPAASMAVSSGAAGTQVDGWPMPGTATTTSFIPVPASAENVVGRDRFLLTLVDRENRPLASPDRKVTLRFFDLARDAAKPTQTVSTDFVWAIEGERGFYVGYADFPAAGEWGVEVEVAQAGGMPETARFRFDVQEKGTTVAVGQPAPSVETKTLADVGGDVKLISTDPKPDPSLYATSVSDALARHEPFVLVFATPAFCQSRVCGPTLEIVKKVKTTEPGVTFINVEPYELAPKDGSLQPVIDGNGQLTPVPAVNAYGLLVEPWIFVVGRDGIIRASFEAVVSEEELRAAIDAAK